MKKTTAIAAALALSLATAGLPLALAFEVQADSIKLTPDEVTICAQQGGCVPVPRAVLAQALYETAERYFAAGMEQGAGEAAEQAFRAGYKAGLRDAIRKRSSL